MLSFFICSYNKSTMKPIVIILLAIFGIYCVMHLVFCFLEKEKLRKWTKPFCMVLLGIAALVAAPAHPLIYIGAFLGAIGDVLLINKSNLKFFLAGTAVFITGHILYYIQIILLFNSIGITVPWWIFLIVFGTLVVLTFALYPLDKKLAGIATLAGNFYMPFLVVLLATGIFFAVFSNKAGLNIWPGIIFALGYFFFFISDSTLVYTTYVKDIKRRDFPIMITYLLGEFGIVFALLLAII